MAFFEFTIFSMAGFAACVSCGTTSPRAEKDFAGTNLIKREV